MLLTEPGEPALVAKHGNAKAIKNAHSQGQKTLCSKRKLFWAHLEDEFAKQMKTNQIANCARCSNLTGPRLGFKCCLESTVCCALSCVRKQVALVMKDNKVETVSSFQDVLTRANGKG